MFATIAVVSIIMLVIEFICANYHRYKIDLPEDPNVHEPMFNQASAKMVFFIIVGFAALCASLINHFV